MFPHRASVRARTGVGAGFGGRAGGRSVGVGRTTARDDATLRRPRPSSSPSPPHSTHARPSLPLARFKAKKKKKKLEGGVPAWLGGYLNRTPARLPIPISTLPSSYFGVAFQMPRIKCHTTPPSASLASPPSSISDTCSAIHRARRQRGARRPPAPRPRNVTVRCGDVAGQRARDRLLLPPLQRGCRRR